jgi:predicted transcriptional regulator
MPVAKIKTEAQAILDKMPDNATWDDLMYEIYVRQAIDAGLEDSDAGRTVDVKDIRAAFGLSE